MDNKISPQGTHLQHKKACQRRELVLQVAEEMGIKVENVVVSSDHVHVFVEIPPNIKISNFVQKVKGSSSKKIQEEFLILRKKYWVRRLWGRSYFSSTSGNVTDDVINEYINKHSNAHEPHSDANMRIE